VANIGSRMSFPIIFLGLFLLTTDFVGLSGFDDVMITVGLILFTVVVILQLITLPVEFNASSRALAMLESRDILSDEEMQGAKKVLSAAAWTYIAATLSAVLTLLRLILIARGGRRR